MIKSSISILPEEGHREEKTSQQSYKDDKEEEEEFDILWTQSSNPLDLKSSPISQDILLDAQKLYQGAYLHYISQDYIKAEREFALFLKPFLSNNSTYFFAPKIEEFKADILSAFYHLGKIYCANNKYLNYAKAAAIFQYCAKFSWKYEVFSLHNNMEIDFLNEAYLTEESFLLSIKKPLSLERLNGAYLKPQKQTESYKAALNNTRAFVSSKLEHISTYDIGQITHRAKEVEELYKICTRFFNNMEETRPGLLQTLLRDCYEALGPIPGSCKHSVIGLGSLATGKMTPWSDLEFVVLISEDKEEYREYFRNVTKLLYIKIINLGETPLRCLGVDSLNNFKTQDPEDDWFWDDLTNSGFGLDGMDWHACKTPLGRQSGYIDKRPFELICTPEQLAQFQKDLTQKEGVSWFESDKYLVLSLNSVIMIEGSLELFYDYIAAIKKTIDHKITQKRIMQKMQEDIDSFSLKLRSSEEGRLIDAKKDIFRIGDRLIENLAIYYEILPAQSREGLTAWEAIDIMAHNNILNATGAIHLKEALSIACELRLATYLHNNGQNSIISTYESSTSYINHLERKNLIKDTFLLEDTSLLHRFYYIIIPAQHIFRKFCDQNNLNGTELLLGDNLLLDESNYIKAMVHSRFLEYDMAVRYMEAEKAGHQYDTAFLIDLYLLYQKIGKIDAAIEVIESVIEIQNQYPNSNIACSFNDLANAYQVKGNLSLAIEYYNKALEIYDKSSISNPNILIARIYSNLAVSFLESGEYTKAKNYCLSSLHQKLEIYSNNMYHPSIAKSYANLASIYQATGEFNIAIEYYNKARQIYYITYSRSPNHPSIAKIYGNLASIHQATGEFNIAIEYYNKALEIYYITYSRSPNHPSIAGIHNNLGHVYFAIDDCIRALTYSSKALEIYQTIFQNISDSLDIKRCKKIMNASIAQLGNIDFISGSIVNENNYYKMIDGANIDIPLTSEFDLRNFVEFQKQHTSISCKLGSIPSAINSQLALLKADPGLIMGNHYQTLASFFAVSGDVNSARAAFAKALESDQKTSSLHVDYARFLINELSLYDSKEISHHLYEALKCQHEMMKLYPKIQKDVISSILQDAIGRNNFYAEINSKVIAYYLLIIYPIYIVSDDSIVNLFDEFERFCKEMGDPSSIAFLQAAQDKRGAQLSELDEGHIDSFRSSEQDSSQVLFSQFLSQAASTQSYNAADQYDHNVAILGDNSIGTEDEM